MSTPLQDALDYACKRGRYLGGWDLIDYSRPPARPQPPLMIRHSEDCLHLNGGGLLGLKQDAARLAIRKANGNATEAARMLGIGRTYLYQFARRAGIAAILVVVLAGCKVSPQRQPSPIAARLRELAGPTTTSTAQAATIAPAAVKVSWTHPSTDPAIVFEVWASGDLSQWDLAHETAAHEIFIPANQPMEFYKVRARDTSTGQVSDWATTATREIHNGSQHE